MARGRCLSGARPGVPGRAARLQELVRFAIRQAQRPEGQAPETPPQAPSPIDPAHRNGFTLHGDRLYVAKVGNIKVGWSRDLPSEPSSVTVIREPDGRHYASFVVRREVTPLSACDRETGIDLGLNSLIVTSDGETIPNPRLLHKAQRQLRRAHRVLSRRQKGSANRAKARHRVAVLHRKVRDTRRDHAHKVALRLIRDNQAVYAEDLPVSGLMRTWLARSVADAGWSQLVRLIEEKAAWYGRTFRKIGRFEPTSQVCSACGQGRPQAAERPRVGLRRVRDGSRPGRQCRQEHPRRRAGGEAKRLWNWRKTTASGGSRR